MEWATLIGLVGLALIDSTSFGTLAVPVVMLVQRRVNVRALLVYLLTIGGFYFLVGLALLAGLRVLMDALSNVSEHPITLWGQLVIGAALFAASFLLDKRGSQWRRDRRRRRGLPDTPSRQQRWTASVVGDDARRGAVIGVALGAGLIEVASMLPYLAAVTILSGASLPTVGKVGVLAGYVLLMTVPALLLLAGRVLGAGLVGPLLERLRRLLARNSEEMIGWVVGIVGFLLAADAFNHLQALGALGMGA